MPINENIFVMADKIYSDEMLTEHLLTVGNFEDAYEFCYSVQGGYTKEEFYDWLEEFYSDESMDIYSRKLYSAELESVSAGSVTNIFKKATATSLAALTAITMMPNSFAADDKPLNSNQGFSASIKKKIGNWFKENKNTLIAIGVVGAVVLICATATATGIGISHWWEKSGRGAAEHDYWKDHSDDSTWQKIKNFWSGDSISAANEGAAKIKRSWEELSKDKSYTTTFKEYRNEIIDEYNKSQECEKDFWGRPKKDNEGNIKYKNPDQSNDGFNAVIKKYNESVLEQRKKEKEIEEKIAKNIYAEKEGLKQNPWGLHYKNMTKAELEKIKMPDDGSWTGERIAALDGARSSVGLAELSKRKVKRISIDEIQSSSDAVKYFLGWVQDHNKAIKYTTIGIFGISGAAAGIAAFAKNFEKIVKFCGSIGEAVKLFRHKIDSWANNVTTNPIPLNQCLENFDNYVVPLIEGQEEAKSTIKNDCLAILKDKQLYEYQVAQENTKPKSERKMVQKRGYVMYWAGPSGVGKTSMARALVDYKVLANGGVDDFWLIDRGYVNPGSDKSVVDQLFGGNDSYYSFFDDDKSKDTEVKKKSLTEFIENHPGRGVIVIDDVDKYWNDKSLENALASIAREGTVTVNDKKIDCHGITFIVTSNETNEFFPEVHKSSTYGIKHDPAAMNSFKRCTFKNLNKEYYYKIMKRKIYETVIKFWKDYNNLDVIIDDEVYHKIAECLHATDNGAHIWTTFSMDIEAPIIKYVVKSQAKIFENGKTIYISGKIKKDSYGASHVDAVVRENPEKPVYDDDEQIETSIEEQPKEQEILDENPWDDENVMLG